VTETIVINPLTRLEGTGRVKIEVEGGALKDLQFSVAVGPRFFEYLLTNKQAEDAPRISERICGICYVNHHLVSVKAVEDAWGVQVPEVATLLRRTLNAASFITSHTLYLAFLALPDLIPIENRNVIGVADANPDLASVALQLHEYGNRVVTEIGGRLVHVVTSVPGGQTKGLTGEARYKLLREGRIALTNVRKIADALFSIYEKRANDPSEYMGVETPYMGLVTKDGEYELYDGEIRVKNGKGVQLLQFPAQDYYKRLEETTSGHSFTKIPYLKDMGPIDGLMRVGPLARINVIDKMQWNTAAEYLKAYEKTFRRPTDDTAAYNLARTVELVASVDEVLNDLGNDVIMAERTREPVKAKAGAGYAFVEAPRGLLYHSYEIDEKGIIKAANIVAPTTFNHKSIENNLRRWAEAHASDFEKRETRQDAMWGIEKIVRAYDPCLSCSVHMVDVDLTVDGEKYSNRREPQ
jgi:F420-non-reducing hydrogenase large subunit